MIRIRDNRAAIFIRSRDSEAAVLENIENTKGKRGKGEEEEEKKPRRFESLVVSRDAITATGRTNFLRFDLKCHSRSGIEGEEVNERKGEGWKRGRDRYRILGIEADEKENRAGSAESHWIPGARTLSAMIVLINCQGTSTFPPPIPIERADPQSDFISAAKRETILDRNQPAYVAIISVNRSRFPYRPFVCRPRPPPDLSFTVHLVPRSRFDNLSHFRIRVFA